MKSMLCVTGVYLRTHLHFLCIWQRVNQRLLNSHYHPEWAATDQSWLLSNTAFWSLGMRAVCMHHQAVSGDLDAPSFWSCNQQKVYF